MRSRSLQTFVYLFVASVACCASKSARSGSESQKAREIVQANVRTFPEGAASSEPQLKRMSQNGITLSAWSRDFARGSVVLFEFTSANDLSGAVLRVDTRELHLSRGQSGWFTLFANPPESRRRQNILSLLQNGKTLAEFKVPVVQKQYPVSVSQMTVNKFSNQSKPMTKETLEMIEQGRKRKLQAFVSSPDNYLSGEFRYPRDEHKITSPFFIKRVYERFKMIRGKKKKLAGRTSYHGGTDLKGQKGAPIFAVADGKVNLAEHLYYEGNIIIIDHGNGIISGYMHQSELLVKTGDKVKAGQQIGRSGDTGMVTGPHLHIFLLVHGIKADPLSLLVLPVNPAR